MTIARALTNTFFGIALNGILPFVLAQIIGAVSAYWLLKNLKKTLLSKITPAQASRVGAFDEIQ